MSTDLTVDNWKNIRRDSEKMLNDTLRQLHEHLTMSPEGEVFDLAKLANMSSMPKVMPTNMIAARSCINDLVGQIEALQRALRMSVHLASDTKNYMNGVRGSEISDSTCVLFGGIRSRYEVCAETYERLQVKRDLTSDRLQKATD